jgi:CheY-like chemotaxis protein/nitrogen-specific signal transduction histidine kinase
MARTRSHQTKRRKPKSAPPPARRASHRGQSAAADEIALAAFAHDVRTALTGILALGELLASSNLGARERRWAAGVKSGAEHLAALTSLLVDGAKARAGALRLRQEVFRPRRLIEALAESLAARAQTKDLDAEVRVADEIPERLVGDPARLRAALENLLDNAVKFTDRGAVQLEARAAPAGRGRIKLQLTVSDNGIGLSASEIKRLFRPFAQANPEIARRYGGAGLGLIVVKQLAKRMGGDLAIASSPGRGSSFSFSAVLPLAAADAAQQENHARRLSSVPAPHLNILCAEDNPYGRVILNTILTELGHRADFVGSGEDAVSAVTRGYDLLLVDVTLPDISGLEAARRIRALSGPAARIPIIGVSGRSEVGDEDAARAAGMVFYLRKPISPSALAAAIAAAGAASG